MKRLIIHPEDPSTTFLEGIYKDLPPHTVTVVRGGCTRAELLNMAEVHDSIWMMGHGSPNGLLSVGQFDGWSYIVDQAWVPILKRKQHNVFIWCYASEFCESHQLQGFSSGMFISEVSEAFYCGVNGVKQQDVDNSNACFSKIVAPLLIQPGVNLLDQIWESEYGRMAQQNPVAAYNISRLAHFVNSEKREQRA